MFQSSFSKRIFFFFFYSSLTHFSFPCFYFSSHTQKKNKKKPASNYKLAIEKYTLAIEANPKVAAYYANRAFAHIRMESFGYAIADATIAIELDSRFIKVRLFI